MKRPPLRALAAALFAVAAASGPAMAQAPAVIPPGQEPLLADMLGKGASLPGDCAWAGATVEQTRVVSWYTCAGARVEVELRHPADAPPGATRTDRFAVRARGASSPPGLVDALAARIRAREAEFQWRGGGSGLVPLVEEHRDSVRGLGVALAIGAVAAGLMGYLYRRIGRIAVAARPSPAAAVAFSALAIAVSTGFAAAVHRAARAFGDASLASLQRGAGIPIAASTGAMLAYLLLAVGASALLARIPARLPSWARFAAGAAIYVAFAYPRTLVRERPPDFGGVVAGQPNMEGVDVRPNRPPVTYRTTALGFREPGFSFDKPQGTYRVALLGDSYVYGIGVEVYDTLSTALRDELVRRWPGRSVEVLNLGIPGNNLSSHIDVYVAAERLAIDAAVFCLTLPNDLSRWDVQIARRESARAGLFSFARFFFGDAAGPFWDIARLERTLTAAGIRHLDQQMTRLTDLRVSAKPLPLLVFFSFRELAAPVRARLEAVPGARVVPEGETGPDDFLRGDGHPSGSGNRRFAAQIAAALGASPAR